jgi:hypothetical protein
MFATERFYWYSVRISSAVVEIEQSGARDEIRRKAL